MDPQTKIFMVEEGDARIEDISFYTWSTMPGNGALLPQGMYKATALIINAEHMYDVLCAADDSRIGHLVACQDA